MKRKKIKGKKIKEEKRKKKKESTEVARELSRSNK